MGDQPESDPLTPSTPVRFEFYRTMGSTPMVLEATLDEFIDPEQLPSMTRDQVFEVIGEAHSEWLVEQVSDSACFTVGKTDR